MKIFAFFEYLKTFGLLRPSAMLDFGDRVAFLFSTVVLVVCSLIIGAKEYFTKPIACMIVHKAAGLTMMDELMIENYCWVTGVYPFRAADPLPDGSADWDKLGGEFITYYLWVPLVLGLQGVLVYLPKLAFDLLSFSRVMSNLTCIATSAREAALKSKQERSLKAKEISACLQDLLDATREYRDPDSGLLMRFRLRLQSWLPCCIVSKRFGNCVFAMYLAAKLVGTADLLLQLEIMRQFLGFQNIGFGAALLRNITTGKDWETTRVLPRVGVCRIRYQDRGSVNTMHPYCTISSNIFIEKIYIFLWFYFVAAAAVNVASLLLWLWRFALPSNRRAHVKALVRGRFQREELGEPMVRFESEFLRKDGLFYVMMIRQSCGQIITCEIVQHLYAAYLQRIREGKALASNSQFEANDACRSENSAV